MFSKIRQHRLIARRIAWMLPGLVSRWKSCRSTSLTGCVPPLRFISKSSFIATWVFRWLNWFRHLTTLLYMLKVSTRVTKVRVKVFFYNGKCINLLVKKTIWNTQISNLKYLNRFFTKSRLMAKHIITKI